MQYLFTKKELIIIKHLFVDVFYNKKNQNFNQFLNLLKKQIKHLLKNYKLQIKTIYIATSDLMFLNDQELLLLLKLFKEINNFDYLIEYNFEIGYFTLLNKNQLKILKNFGITRLIWKIRTFNNDLLVKINKKFSINHLKNLIENSTLLGFNNCSFDLKYNIDFQNKKDIFDDLQIALNFQVSHISYQSNNDYYNLEIKKMINTFLEKYNYYNYEFFSFAKKEKFYSYHTLAYLNLENWYGLGSNATGFFSINNKRFIVKNKNFKKYIKKISKNYYYQLLIIQGLMLKTGFLLEEEKLLAVKQFWPVIFNLIKTDKLQLKNNYLLTTNSGWLLLNDILIDIISGK